MPYEYTLITYYDIVPANLPNGEMSYPFRLLRGDTAGQGNIFVDDTPTLFIRAAGIVPHRPQAAWRGSVYDFRQSTSRVYFKVRLDESVPLSVIGDQPLEASFYIKYLEDVPVPEEGSGVPVQATGKNGSLEDVDGKVSLETSSTAVFASVVAVAEEEYGTGVEASESSENYIGSSGATDTELGESLAIAGVVFVDTSEGETEAEAGELISPVPNSTDSENGQITTSDPISSPMPTQSSVSVSAAHAPANDSTTNTTGSIRENQPAVQDNVVNFRPPFAPAKTVQSDIRPAIFDELLGTRDWGKFELYTYYLLKLLGIHNAYYFNPQQQSGQADGFFKFGNLAVIYDCTLRQHFEEVKRIQIENYCKQLESGYIEVVSTPTRIVEEFQSYQRQVWIITRGRTRLLERRNEIAVKEIHVNELLNLYEYRLRNAFGANQLENELRRIDSQESVELESF